MSHPENFRHQKDDVKEILHWGPTSIWCHRTKSSTPIIPTFVCVCVCRGGGGGRLYEKIYKLSQSLWPVAGPGIGHGTSEARSSEPGRWLSCLMTRTCFVEASCSRTLSFERQSGDRNALRIIAPSGSTASNDVLRYGWEYYNILSSVFCTMNQHMHKWSTVY